MRHNSQFFSKLPLGIIIAIMLFATGCTLVSTPPPTAEWTPLIGGDTATPEPEGVQVPIGDPLAVKYAAKRSYMSLPDGSKIYIASDAEFEITKIAGLTAGASGHEVLLHSGEILIVSELPAEETFTVISPEGYIAQVAGSIMVVSYDLETGQFTIDCIEGDCNLGPNTQSLFLIAVGYHGWLDRSGNFQGPFEAIMQALCEKYGEDLIACEIDPIGSETPTITPPASWLDATATAICAQFEEENPGTPCPYIDIEATATAACEAFEEENPGTPCP